MPFFPNNHAEHTFRFSLGGDPELQITTLGTRWTSGSETLAELATAVGDAMALFWAGGGFNNWVFQDVVSRGTDATAVDHEASVTYNDTGPSSGDALPTNCALLIRKQTPFAGRRHRGRFYMPGVLGEDVVNALGIIDPTAVAIFQANADVFFDSLDTRTPDSQPVILHTDGGTPTVCSSFTVQNQIATQRRRMRP